MGQRNPGIFSIEKTFAIYLDCAINRELTRTLMRLIAIKYFNRLTALIYIYILHFTDHCETRLTRSLKQGSVCVPRNTSCIGAKSIGISLTI